MSNRRAKYVDPRPPSDDYENMKPSTFPATNSSTPPASAFPSASPVASTPDKPPADPSLVSAHGTPLEVRCPFDGSLVGTVPTATEEDVDAAVRSARTAQRAWARVNPRQRARIIATFARLVLDEEERILDLIQQESGKNRLSAFEEVMDVARLAAHYASQAPSLLRTKHHAGAIPVLTRTRELRHPKGVIGIISPWNYPFTLAASDTIPALLAGNAVVMKPDSQTPFTAILVLELLQRAGLPAGLFQLVPGAGSSVGPLLIERVDFLMFTGSTATGTTIAQQCASRLIGYSAELGGKNPMLVLADADPQKAARGAVKACFSNTGQLCVSIERIYVNTAVYESFVRAFTAATRSQRIGPGFDWTMDVGSLVSQKQLQTVTAHVEDAVSKGATVLTGGQPRPDLGPLFYEPTILSDVPDNAVLAHKETFGPVVAVYRVFDDDEAIQRANDTEYGLNASVWSASGAHARRVAERLEAGTVNINDGYAAAWASQSSPMGGWKQSGVGRRHGTEGLLKYTEPQTVAHQRLHPIAPLPGMTNADFGAFMSRALRIMDRLGF